MWNYKSDIKNQIQLFPPGWQGITAVPANYFIPILVPKGDLIPDHNFLNNALFLAIQLLSGSELNALNPTGAGIITVATKRVGQSGF